ncbi:hypothetical protein [Haliangium sp.]|uniref:hypothetical protein n=1 Tax=Haliangium sp. TaxID=2663208 RepID=UPI003D0C6C86
MIEPERTRAEILDWCDFLERTAARFEQDETAVAKDMADDIEARAARDRELVDMTGLLVAIRSRVREGLGQEGLQLYRLNERSPTGFEALGRYAGDVVVLLTQQPRTAQSPLGDTIDTAALGATLSAALTRYREALDTVAREARETEAARIARRESEARFRQVLVSVAVFLEHYLRMAGDEELANRVRPTQRRAGGEVDVELPDDGDDGDDGNVGGSAGRSARGHEPPASREPVAAGA